MGVCGCHCSSGLSDHISDHGSYPGGWEILSRSVTCLVLNFQTPHGRWSVTKVRRTGARRNFQRAFLLFSPFPFLGCVPSNDGVFIYFSLLFLEDPNIFMYSIWLVNSVPVFKSEHHPILCGVVYFLFPYLLSLLPPVWSLSCFQPPPPCAELSLPSAL